MASPQAERYLASLPYEDQQQIRAGGDVDAWYNAAVAAGAVPGAGGAPAATPAGGWANATAQQAGINPWQQDYKQEFARTDSTALARMSDMQRAKWAMTHLDALDYRDRESAFQQWLAWQKHFDPSCPSSAPFRAEDGSGCVEKPDNSNVGYQQGQQGQGGAGGGRGGQGQVNASLNSPLKQMLMNQGSFLGGYDQNRGDGQAGVRGGVVGGGGIWWQPTQGQPQTGGVDVMDGARGGVKSPTDPRYGGIMGGQGITPRLGGPKAPTSPFMGGIMGGQNVPMGSSSPLTQTMAGVQGSGAQSPSPLLGAMTPLQQRLQKRKTALSGMFGGVGNWFSGG